MGCHVGQGVKTKKNQPLALVQCASTGSFVEGGGPRGIPNGHRNHRQRPQGLSALPHEHGSTTEAISSRILGMQGIIRAPKVTVRAQVRVQLGWSKHQPKGEGRVFDHPPAEHNAD